MNIFLLGGWAARPCAFYFCVIAGSLSYSVRPAFRCRLALIRVTVLGYVFPVARVLICLSLSPLPVPSMPSISASLGSRYPHNQKTRLAYLCTFYSLICIFMQCFD